MTVGGDASVAGRLELFGGQALAENQSSEDVLASARWRPVTLDVGGKLAVAGDTTLHGTDANVIRMGDARAVGDGRASDAGVMRIRVTGDSVIGGGLALQAGSADIMNTRSASDTAQATGQSVQYVAQGDLRVAQGITLQAGSARWDALGGTSGSTVSPRGNSSLQASANVTSDGPVSVLAGTHYVAARPAVLQFRETAMLAFRETAIDAPAYAAAGSATLSVAGTLTSVTRTDWSWPASLGPRCPATRSPAVPMASRLCRRRCAARQRPSVTPVASASARWICATPAPS